MNRLVGAEDVRTHLDSCQARFMARCVEDPSKLEDILPVGFGDEGHDVLTEGVSGRRMASFSTLMRMAVVLSEGKPL